ncbi:SusC/RagA family TonB-linked outer membrane protein, partial [Ferruginibacter sp.]|uniref:SusC/RagA family TonB-linked outer membrane protein n=1 Tax=Ferruginibacter sp. TaxID=1940288 RepID=UPI0019AE0DCD
MFKKLLFISCIMFLALASFAQKIIKGKVTDENGSPIVGVSVIEKTSKKGTQTDQQGNYSIAVSPSAKTLVFSSIGIKSSSENIIGKETVNVTLERSTSTGDEVVVIGYSTVKRKDLTGTVSSVGAKQLKDIPLSSAAEALQGRLAGVQVTASEGAPGADLIIRVRGGGSITQDNSPLYIVDGVQVENALSVISPQDIQTIDVLKDASTAAIYGARGANGVIIITTKPGKPGKTTVTYNGAYGTRSLPKKLEVLSPYDFVTWQWERTRGVTVDSSSFAKTYGTTWDTLKNYQNISPINWQEEVFGKNATYQNHNVSVNGGNQATSFNLSLTANREDGILLESGFDRNLVNFKLDHKISDKFKMGMTARYLDQSVRGAGTTNSGTRTTNKLRSTITYRPFEIAATGGGIDDFDEAYFLASSGATNPIVLTRAEYRKQFTKATYLSGYLNYNITKKLVFRSTFGFDNTATAQDLFFSKITGTARNAASLPVASKGLQNNRTLTISNTLQYAINNFKKHHDFNFLVGQEIIDVRVNNSFFQTNYFPSDISPQKALANMGLGSSPSSLLQQPLPFTFVNPPSRIASFFGRVNYAFDDKYLATFNLRSDRSSKFAPTNGNLIFPSGSVAWRFTKENLFKNVKW